MVEIENVSVNEREKLYSRYEGSSIISLYARVLGSGLDLVDVMGYEFTIDNEDNLITDLGKDPFISTALSSCLCEVYYKYGLFLAPITGPMISAKHFKIKQFLPT